ncbi:MAG: hypothetical protein ACOYL8_03675 [Patescibacteria group bacterium]
MENEIIRSISDGHEIYLEALDGGRLFYSVDDLGEFPNSDFFQHDFTKPGVATPRMQIEVGEMKQRDNMKEVFGALPGNWNQKWLSQDQVIEFVRNFSHWLLSGQKNDNATIFVIKIDENEPVDEKKPEENLIGVIVCKSVEGLKFFLYHFGPNFVWRYCRVVYPKIA